MEVRHLFFCCAGMASKLDMVERFICENRPAAVKLLADDWERFEQARDLWMRGLAKVADSSTVDNQSGRFDIKSVDPQIVKEKIESNIHEVSQMELEE